MSFAVVLYFDPQTEIAVAAIREKLIQRGIHPIPDGMQNQPHLTLGMWNGGTPPGFPEALERFAGSLSRTRLLFSSAGVFPTREGVIFLAPVVTPELLDLHERFHRAVVPTGLEADRHYLPGFWVPHCTLAVYLADWEMHSAVDIAREAPMPFEGIIEAVGIVEFPPLKAIGQFPLNP